MINYIKQSLLNWLDLNELQAKVFSSNLDYLDNYAEMKILRRDLSRLQQKHAHLAKKLEEIMSNVQ